MRKSDVPPPEDITPSKLDITEQRRTYRLITPLYGGGVTSTMPDPITVVRGTEIRGQLRFWWRACRGWQSDGDPNKLKTLEDAIWGKAYKKKEKGTPWEQTVQILVDAETVKPGEPVKPFYMKGRQPKPNEGIPDYAAFPLQPDQEERKKQLPFIPDVYKDMQFTLTIMYPPNRGEEIEAALWAWETFGGLGARTRRGFGALCLLAVDDASYQDRPASSNVKQKIQEMMDKYIKSGSFPTGVPHLSKEMQLVVTPSSKDSMQAWSNLVNKLRTFRQQKDAANKRSAWPEADAIRRIAGKKTGNTQTNLQKFPRAAFGLPIIFHFTGSDMPADHTLNEADERGDSKERFASPLILRPFLCSDKRAVGLALLLEGSRVDLEHLVLQEKGKEGKESHKVKGILEKDEARKLSKRVQDLENEADVLQAFMNYLRRQTNVK